MELNHGFARRRHVCVNRDAPFAIETALKRRQAQWTKNRQMGRGFRTRFKFAPRAHPAASVKTARCLIIFSDADLHGLGDIIT